MGFGLGNSWYEVDLTDEERKKLEQPLQDIVKVARKTGNAPTEKKRSAPSTTVEERVRACPLCDLPK